MKSDYFEKIQKRYDELAKEGYRLVSRQKFYQSLLEELPNVPDDTYCTHEFMFRIRESIYKDQSFKTLSYRRYNSETSEWSDWRDNDFNEIDDMTRTIVNSSPSVYWKDDDGCERVGFMWDVILKDKKIYLLNMAIGEEEYAPNKQLVLYAPELLQKKYVRKSDKKEIGGDLFPWLYIYVGLPVVSSHTYAPVGAEIFSLHNSETKEESRNSFARQLVNGYPEVYHSKRRDTDLYKKTVEEVEACLEKGILPEELVNAPIHIDYNSAMFTPAEGLQQAQERINELEKKLNEINPEFLRLKKILDMSPEEREKFLREEEKKDKELKKQKAAERAAKKAEKEAEEKKKSKLFWIGTAVWLITLMSLCGITFALDEFLYIEGWVAFAIFAGGILIVHFVWKTVKKHLKRKWGIKDEE